MINVMMEIPFVVSMPSLFLPKYECCINESFLSKASIENNENVTCIVELLILLLILNNLLKKIKFSFVISLLIILFAVSGLQAFN